MSKGTGHSRLPAHASPPAPDAAARQRRFRPGQRGGLQAAGRPAIFAQTDDRKPGISHDAHPSSGRHDRGPRLAAALAEAGLPAVYSYAGRTENPRAQPLPTRSGGFGGAEGLAAYLREGITHLIDATHPFAARSAGMPSPPATARGCR
jgi:hypothetical protein